ncbi:unnamed protein product [Rhizophagus irregularis]|uniref:HAT C-terminal dimerisation domain-containing protein n=1 Tax=Rhizophagus irregularis TaxID=588596 RepID=A0A916E8M2_9GLOM|nr:unnamed protein product [Rhizophagus irregularis]
MATTTRSKRKQMEQMTKEAEENLIQEVIEVNESDLDSNTETSHLVIQEESEIDPDYEVEDSHVLLQDITTLSVDISNINIDDLEAEFLEISKQSKQPPIKTTRPKTSWVWKFFELNKDNSKALCQISGCSKMLKWCGSPSSLSTHLSGTHGITKDIAMKYRISKTFEVGKDTLKNQLTQVEYISLTLDAWSSPAHLPYLGVTAHWITSDFEPYEVLLSIEELPYPHGATEIQEHLIDLFYEWGIESKITAVVTDNGSNVKKACNEIGIGERIPCSAHTLQLSIGKGLDKIKLLVDKCKRLIIFLAGDKKKQQLKESQIHLYRQEILQDDELEKEVENLICLDVIKVNNTRWNSTLYAFQRLIILKSAIAMLKTTLMNNTNLNICKEGEKLEELYPTVYEWKVIKEMIKLLSPFEAATRLLSGVKYPTIGFTYPCICNLKDRLETDFTSLETMDAKHCRNAMLEDLTLRWNYPQELCLKGSFFDPRFKSLDFINSQEECNNIVNQLKEEFMIFKHNEQSDISIISEKNTDELRTEMASFWKKKNTKVAPIKDEFQHYFDVAELPALEEYDPYLWWSTNKNQYPVLHKLAMKYLSIPATSVPSERLFSDAKNLITPQRTRLNSFIINQLMFLKRNREYIDIYE